MPVQIDTFATRRHLPHLEKRGKSYFVTFSTIGRRILSSEARTIVLTCCVHDHDRTYCLECAVVMPDHVHMVFTPYEMWTMPLIMKRVKGNSARLINAYLGRRGAFWEEESFDRILRGHEQLRKKAEYVCQNPVSEGLADTPDEYPWIWRLWIEGGQAGLPVLHRSV
ncbi:MAG TPA: transposase [Thermoanaerobaculia bacterium]|nr:transposase [Thermoanaerobaculia bacterium]